MKLLFTLIAIIGLQINTFSQFSSNNQSSSRDYHFSKINEAENLMLIGGQYVSKSIDNGSNWEEFNLGVYGFPNSNYLYEGAAIVSANEFYLIGNDTVNGKGIVLKTLDGGQNWISSFETTDQSLIYFKDILLAQSQLVLATLDGIYSSNDGGSNWDFMSFGNNEQMHYLQYNSITDTWLCGSETSSTFYLSTDNGLSWITAFFENTLTGRNTQIGLAGAYFTLNNCSTIPGNSEGTFYLIDNNLSIHDSIPYSSSQTSNSKTNKAFFLPDGNIISASELFFNNIDTSNFELSYYDHQLHSFTGSLSKINDFYLSENYGIAVGDSGAISLFNINSFSELYLPATTNLHTSYCTGETIFASATFDYADSIRWFFDGQLVSDFAHLIYSSDVSGPHQLIISNWFQGNQSSDTFNYIFPEMLEPPIYSITFTDQQNCFNRVISISGTKTFSGSYPNFRLELHSTNHFPLTIINSTAVNSFTYTGPTISSHDTLYVISSYTQSCGTTHDTIMHIPNQWPDLLEGYSYSAIKDTFCSGEYIPFNLLETNPAYRYSVKQYFPSWTSSTVYGTTNDTLLISGPNLFSSVTDTTFASKIFEITIQGGNNCIQKEIIDTALVINPTARFFPHSVNYFTNDTLKLTDANPTGGNTWSSTPNQLTISNPEDSIPDIYSSTEGIYRLTLKNNPLVACMDSMYRDIRIGHESNQEISRDICWSQNGPDRYNVMKVKEDFAKNIYEIGVKTGFSYSSYAPNFMLTKRNPEGEILWEKNSPDTWGGGDFEGAVIVDVEIDPNGDVYCGMWIAGDFSSDYELIHYDGESITGNTLSFLIKLDGGTGEMLWVKPAENSSIGYSRKITDLVLTDNYIIYALTTSSSTTVVTATHDGNILTFDNIYDPYSQGTPTFPYNLYIESSSLDNSKSYQSPQLKLLSNGEILCISNYQGCIFDNNVENLELRSLESGNKIPALLAFKYTPNGQLHSFKKLATIPSSAAFDYHLEGTPYFDIDNESNITLSCSWDITDKTTQILDSTISVDRGTCVFQIDENYNLNWLNILNYCNIQSLEIVKETGDIYFSSKVQDNISFAKGNEVIIIGEYGNYAADTNTFYDSWVLNNYEIYPRDFFFGRLSSDGNFQDGKFINTESVPHYGSFLDESNIRISTNPCGDLTVVINPCPFSQSTTNFTMDNIAYSLYQSMTFKYSDQCSNSSCIFAQIDADTLSFCVNPDSLFIPFNTFYGIDSVYCKITNTQNEVDSLIIACQGQGFYLDLPGTFDSLKVHVYYPVTDSLTILIHNAVTPSFSFDSLVCTAETMLVTANPAGISYSWNGNAFSQNNTYSFIKYTSGNFQLTCLTSDANECSVSDTLLIHVFAPIPSQLQSSYPLECGDTLVLPIDTANYNSISYSISGTLVQNSFSDDNLLSGTNLVSLTLIDTNACQLSAFTTISYCLDADLNKLEDESASLNILPNPSNGKFEIMFPKLIDFGTVELFNTEGKLIHQNKIEQQESIFFDLDLANGTYLLILKTHNSVQQQKVIICR